MVRADTSSTLYFPNVASGSTLVGVNIGSLGLQGASFTIGVWVRPAAGAMTAWPCYDADQCLAILGMCYHPTNYLLE